jgi:AcrR family transcriptional regulator
MPRTATKAPVPAQQKPAPGIEARNRILDVAEQLFGERGLHGASLREISAAAGQANTSAVQYHFGGKEGLVAALIAREVERFEPRRLELLAPIEGGVKPADVRELLKVMFLPLAEATDADGRHGYARFLMQFLFHIRYQVPVEHPGLSPDRATARAGKLLLDALPFLGMAGIVSRIDRLAGLFLNAIIDRENAIELGRTVESEEDFLADLFSMMTGALSAPAHESRR